MATYTAVKGVKVLSLASDPSEDVEGEVWYNTAGYVWKVRATDNGGYVVKTITTS